jgi:spermidine synthase
MLALSAAVSTIASQVSPSPRIAPAELALLASVFVVAACGLVYELAAGALASYLLGDSVLQFSTVIGTYLFAMGIGSWLSRFVERQLVAQFLRIELLVGLVGGLMPALLFVAHSSLPGASVGAFRVLLYGLVLLVGVLVGLEIPLVMRILKRQFAQRYALKDLVSQVLTFDYLGALVVALAFPLLFVPHLGLMRTGSSSACSMRRGGVGAVAVPRRAARFRLHALACAAGGGGAAGHDGRRRPLTTWAEDHFYGDDIILRETATTSASWSPAAGRRAAVPQRQPAVPLARRIPLPRDPGAPGAGRARCAAARAGAGWRRRHGRARGAAPPGCEQVTLVELDPHMTRLFGQHPLLTRLNAGALPTAQGADRQRRRLHLAGSHRETFDVIVVDFPDPTNFSLGKLYTTSFYQRADQAIWPPAATWWCRPPRR